MKRFKKLLAIFASAALLFTAAACSGDDNGDNGGDATTAGGTTAAPANNGGNGGNDPPPADPDFDLEQDIRVITRDADSGTRGAIVYLADITREVDGEDVDAITNEAEIVGGTAQALTAVENNDVAIGYISFGSLTSAVRALSIDGVAATTDNIIAEEYSLQRPFNITNNGDMSAAAQDFWNFLLSAEGQAIVADEKYVVHPDNNNAPAFETNGASGSITVGGSTSVESLMSKLIVAYEALDGTNVTVELQGGGSGAGEAQVADGTFDIGMVSREVRNEDLTSAILAVDGIAVIVNTSNPITNISLEDLRAVFLGEVTVWAELD
jgi:phosphate transport system substrate-binding protein